MDQTTSAQKHEPIETGFEAFNALLGNTMKSLESFREKYEQYVQGAETGLPLNHPKIAAMYLFDNASLDSSIIKKLNFEDVAKVSRDIQGKNFSAARELAGQQ